MSNNSQEAIYQRATLWRSLYQQTWETWMLQCERLIRSPLYAELKQQVANAISIKVTKHIFTAVSIKSGATVERNIADSVIHR